MLAMLVLVLAQAGIHEAHAKLKLQLDTIEDRLGVMAELAPAAQQETMAMTLRFLTDLKKHAAGEETGIYAQADAKVGGARRFTESMRYEHRIVERWAEGLRVEKAPLRFAREGLLLVGLLRAHFEEEEQVVLPLLQAKAGG